MKYKMSLIRTIARKTIIVKIIQMSSSMLLKQEITEVNTVMITIFWITKMHKMVISPKIVIEEYWN